MIVIAPYAQKLRNGKRNAKNYPYWKELIALIDEPIVQVGVTGEEQLVDDFRKNLSMDELAAVVRECRTWISCDSFMQHFGWDLGKKGIVLWGPSDPKIFGHPENINLLKDRSYLVKDQFVWWEDTEHQDERFVKPEEIMWNLSHLPLQPVS
jgi:ADP-heptose:LPS heptosyltransferase